MSSAAFTRHQLADSIQVCVLAQSSPSHGCSQSRLQSDRDYSTRFTLTCTSLYECLVNKTAMPYQYCGALAFQPARQSDTNQSKHVHRLQSILQTAPSPRRRVAGGATQVQLQRGTRAAAVDGPFRHHSGVRLLSISAISCGILPVRVHILRSLSTPDLQVKTAT